MRPLTSPPSVIKEFTYKWRNWVSSFYQTVKDWGITGDSKQSLSVTIADIESIRVDANVTASTTRLMLYDVDNATLERVSVGAPDSGGAGFKLLRIPN